MDIQAKAAEAFTALDKAILDAMFGRSGKTEAEVEKEFGYHHGWMMVEGKNFCHETAFPDKFFPRFPADQGLSD